VPPLPPYPPPQVERLVCGNPNLDFEALERNSKYDGGFSVATPAVQWLWQVGRGGFLLWCLTGVV
jgi:hypothetical protein